MGRRSASRSLVAPSVIWTSIVFGLLVGAALVVRGSSDSGPSGPGSSAAKACSSLSDRQRREACERGLHVGCANEEAVSRPTAERAPAIARFQVGLVMRNCDNNDRLAATILQPKVVRFEIDALKPSSGDHWVDFYAGIGAVPQPLANFHGVPNEAQIDALAAWARSNAPRITLIELGNEDSYTYKYGDGPDDASYQERARAYGAATERLGQRLAGSGVGVLAQADDADTGSSVWVDQMYAAAPDLHKSIAGWVLHPYGPDYMMRVDRLDAQVGAHGGAGLKIYCTELGLATDDGRELSNNYGWPTNMSYRSAADTLQSLVKDLEASGKVAEAMLYQSTDQQASGTTSDREAFFGLLQKDGTTSKGPVTRVAIRLLAS